MNIRLQYNNRSILIAERARILFSKLRTDITLRKKNDLRHSLELLYGYFRDFYINIGKPSLKLEPFEAKQMPRSAKFNLTMQQIEDDLSIAYKEADSIGKGFVEIGRASCRERVCQYV